MEYVNARDFTQLSESHAELSHQVVVLTALVGAMLTKASVDYERLEDCVNFAATHMRPGNRPALLGKASAILQDLESMQKTLGIENRKQRNVRKRSGGAPTRQTP